MILTVQLVVLTALVMAIGLCAIYFPYASPLIRPLLPARKRWPEGQIRNWLAKGGFQKSYLAFFYRDPERTPPPGNSVLAPADGVFRSAEVRDGVRYLVIGLSFWDMHVQRSPLGGRITSVESLGDSYIDYEGAEFNFLREKRCPVQKRLVLDTEMGQIAIRLITSLSARRIELWVGEGDTVRRGQRIGRILLGSTVVLELPADRPLTAARHAQVRAGETSLAEVNSLAMSHNS